MCAPMRCEVCGKTTWVGCGQHVDEVRATMAPDRWCDGIHQPEPGKVRVDEPAVGDRSPLGRAIAGGAAGDR